MSSQIAYSYCLRHSSGDLEKFPEELLEEEEQRKEMEMYKMYLKNQGIRMLNIPDLIDWAT